MEESELMKERLQAITEKHRIQEVIRQKKQELDQEKNKLKHLKKKSLREQWLMDASYHPPGSTASEQETRALLLNIYRVEKEIEALEREEAIVSKNEGFILERLKVVERSAEDIIKAANESFVSDPSPVATETLDFSRSYSPTTDDLEPERKTLFALEINVNRNSRTGENTVLSTSSVCPEDLEERPGLKVYDDGRKCVYALHSLEGSDDQSSASELSASEVEQLLKNATIHRQLSQPPHHHNNNNRHRSYRQELGRHLHLPQRHVYTGLTSDDDEPRRRSTNGDGQRRRNGRDVQRVTSFKYPHSNSNNRYASQHVRRHQSFHSNGYSNHRNNNANYANHGNYANHAERRPSPTRRLHYTPSSHIPLADYLSVDEDFHISPAPSPLYGEDTPFTVLSAMETGEATPFTVLSAMETGEPITAVFMGFQPAPDDRDAEESPGELTAELVIIDDDYGKKTETMSNDSEGRGFRADLLDSADLGLSSSGSCEQ